MPKGKPKPYTDLARVEELAARVKPGGAPLKQKEIAAELGLAEATFNQRLMRYDDLRAAFNRGRARAGRPGVSPAVPAEGEAVPDKARGARSRVIDAVRDGARTYGKLLSVTRLDHTELTIALQELARLRIVFVSTVDDERQYFLTSERQLGAARRQEVARAG